MKDLLKKTIIGALIATGGLLIVQVLGNTYFDGIEKIYGTLFYIILVGLFTIPLSEMFESTNELYKKVAITGLVAMLFSFIFGLGSIWEILNTDNEFIYKTTGVSGSAYLFSLIFSLIVKNESFNKEKADLTQMVSLYSLAGFFGIVTISIVFPSILEVANDFIGRLLAVIFIIWLISTIILKIFRGSSKRYYTENNEVNVSDSENI